MARLQGQNKGEARGEMRAGRQRFMAASLHKHLTPLRAAGPRLEPQASQTSRVRLTQIAAGECRCYGSMLSSKRCCVRDCATLLVGAASLASSSLAKVGEVVSGRDHDCGRGFRQRIA